MSVTMKGLTVLLPFFPVRGTGKSVIWMKGYHLPLTKKIRNYHLFHDVPAGMLLRLHSQNHLYQEPRVHVTSSLAQPT